MSVGIPELDEDHQGLIKVINQLQANADNPEGRDVVRQCLVALMRYTEYHFGREERVMAACRYPELGQHGEEHRAFVERIQTILRRFDEDPVGVAAIVNTELLNFLKDWLTHHILIADMAYRPYAEHSAEARQAAKAFKATQIWWGG